MSPHSGAEPALAARSSRIGPNAVIQVGETLFAHGEEGLAQRVYLAAGHLEWLRKPPTAMVDERDAAALHDALHRLAPPHEARAYSAEAGLRTGDYILEHRIPRVAAALLRVLPASLSSRLLARAIARHAWTFAGSGRFSCESGPALSLSIADNPLAQSGGCVWHEAVFTRLFQSLAHRGARVRETSCCASGDDACRFEVRWR